MRVQILIMPAIEKTACISADGSGDKSFLPMKKIVSIVCFVVLHISKENAKIIPAAVEHTIHIDIVVKNSVKSEVTAGHQKR